MAQAIAPLGLLGLVDALGLRCSRCQVCGRSRKPVDPAQGISGGAALLCPECSARLTPRREGFCPACGLLFGNPKAPVAPVRSVPLHPKTLGTPVLLRGLRRIVAGCAAQVQIFRTTGTGRPAARVSGGGPWDAPRGRGPRPPRPGAPPPSPAGLARLQPEPGAGPQPGLAPWLPRCFHRVASGAPHPPPGESPPGGNGLPTCAGRSGPKPMWWKENPFCLSTIS